MAIRRDEQYEGFDWQRDAACRGEHAVAFFPPPHFERKELRLARERRAKAICRTCPVSIACLDYALAAREPHGVWGGLNEVERRLLTDERARRDQPDTTPRPVQVAPPARSGSPDGVVHDIGTDAAADTPDRAAADRAGGDPAAGDRPRRGRGR